MKQQPNTKTDALTIGIAQVSADQKNEICAQLNSVVQGALMGVSAGESIEFAQSSGISLSGARSLSGDVQCPGNVVQIPLEAGDSLPNA
jgi:hypothetical protein